MRAAILTIFLAILALPAMAYHEPERGGNLCPKYDRHVIVQHAPPEGDGTSIETWSNAKGASFTAIADGGRTLYFVEDYLLVNGPGLGGTSLWRYEETNGLPGLQRNDRACDNTPYDAVPDEFL